jgi:hypothetical protein
VYTLAGSGKTLSGTAALSIPNVSISGSYTNNTTLTVSTALAGAGSLTQGASRTLTIGGTATLTTLNASASGNAVNYNASGAQSVLAAIPSYYDLNLSGSGIKTQSGNLVISNNLSVAGTSQLNASTSNYTIDLKKNWNITSTSGDPYVEQAGMVTFSGTSTQSITTVLAAGETFYNLVLSGTSTKTLGSAITCSKDFTNVSGSTFDVSTFNYAVTVKGNWINNGLFTSQLGTVTYNGTAAQTISSTGLTRFNKIIINNLNGVALIAGSYYVKEAIALNNGTFNTGGNLFTLESNAAQTARIAPVTGTGAVTGNFTVERYLPGRQPYWADLASPVSTTLQDWGNELFLVYDEIPATNIKIYSEAIANYVEVTAATTATAGKGFEVYLTDDETLGNFTAKTMNSVGVPNIGSYIIPVDYNPANGVPYAIDPVNGYAGENLIGNPYASAIQVGLIDFGAQVLPTVDVFNYATQSYLTLNNTDIIGPHQGFWAYTSGYSSGTITINETAKTTDLATSIRGTRGTPHFLQLTIASSDPSITNSQTLKVACSPDAQDGWDIKDFPFRKSLNKATPVINSVIGYVPLSINTFHSAHEYYVMPLKTAVSQKGSYQITTKGISFVDSLFPCVRLEDKLLHKFIDLHQQADYEFTASPSDDSSRFALHFSANPQSCDPTATSITTVDIKDLVEVNTTRDGATIQFYFLDKTQTTISVNNILGQAIMKELTLDVQQELIPLNLSDSFHGIYFVKIATAKGIIVRKMYK